MANQILLKLVETNFNFISTEVLPLITKDYLKVSATEVVERLKLTVLSAIEGSVTQETLVSIWGDLPSDPEVIEAFKSAMREAIAKIGEPEVEEGLTLLIDPVTASIVILTDQEGMNKEKLREVWKAFLNSPELLIYGISHLEWLIKKIIKDENVVKWIMKLINAFTSK